MKFTIGHLEVKEGAFGVEISVPWLTDRSYLNYVNLSVREDGVNISATGTLNKEGEEALKDGLTLASLIRKYKD